jgi:hypothetical protein
MEDRSIPLESAIDCRRVVLKANANDLADGLALVQRGTDLQRHGVIE